MPLQQDKLLHARHRPPGWLHRDAGDRVCADAAVRANCRLLAVSTLHAARGQASGERNRRVAGVAFSDEEVLGFSDLGGPGCSWPLLCGDASVEGVREILKTQPMVCLHFKFL